MNDSQAVLYVADVSHYEASCLPHLNEAKVQGLAGLIVQGTQGVGWCDPLAGSFVREANAVGLPVMRYAWGTGTHSGREQAEYFLQNSEPGKRCALDWEWSPTRHGQRRFPEMSIPQAEDFASTILIETGVTPIIYTSAAFLSDLRIHVDTILHDSVLAHCPLWLAGITSRPRMPARSVPNRIGGGPWNDWTLWQFTNGVQNYSGYRTETTGLGKVDCSVFLGSIAELHLLAHAGRPRTRARRGTRTRARTARVDRSDARRADRRSFVSRRRDTQSSRPCCHQGCCAR
jgi:GH25 family lysozyme M1 (1,4-beta-N-acetylmuramidase)